MDCLSLKKLFGIIVCFLFISTASAQLTNYSIHANIVYRFTKYVDWPEQKKTDDFVIGIVGDSRIYDELISLTRSKNVGGQPIVIKHFSSNAKTYNCHILFVSEDESWALKKIADMTAGRPILLVSENTGLIWKGACINFLVIGDQLKLEFSKTNIERRQLNIASELLNLGTIIN